MPHIAAPQLLALIEKGEAPAIVDVRSAAEFRAGHVPGAINLPFQTIGKLAHTIAGEAAAPVVLYCGHGPRAWIAAAALRRCGRSNLIYLMGHMAGWRKQHLPEARGAGGAA